MIVAGVGVGLCFPSWLVNVDGWGAGGDIGASQRCDGEQRATECDPGRSTFYAHFRDKDDLLFYGLKEVREAFQPGQEQATLHVFEHFARSGDVWKAMVGRRGGEMFMRYLHGLLSDLLRSQLAARAPAGGTVVPLDALVEFATSTLIGLGTRWWMDKSVALTPKEMDRLYRRLTEPGIRAGLRPLPS
jgi:AcrR family transcriptional regulator